ncbi:hypothetical protein IWQ49_004757 [Labrenzia sp. EL_126]|nr:hypothetical protein [Labrenzia sp. EL_126]
MPIDCFVITFEPCNWTRSKPDIGSHSGFCKPTKVGSARLLGIDPDGSCDLGGESHCHLVNMHSRTQCIDLLTEPIFGSVEVQHAGPRSMS